MQSGDDFLVCRILVTVGGSDENRYHLSPKPTEQFFGRCSCAHVRSFDYTADFVGIYSNVTHLEIAESTVHPQTHTHTRVRFP